MSKLIIQREFSKKAAAEDGPSFETQFGTLANAIIADKYPKLDRMKLAFQLIEKNEDNSDACGVAVYMVGKNVIFIPAFYKGGNIKTGDMMFLAKTQQFIPMSDPWLAWLQDKDLRDAGEVVPNNLAADFTAEEPVTTKDSTDPIIKTACLYLKGLLRTDRDLTKTAKDCSLLDTVVAMGKTASGAMLDKLIDDNTFLNATLRFYDGNALDEFSKKAALLGEETEEVSVILPFTKEAKNLSATEKEILDRDGFIIKRAAEENAPNVIRMNNISKSFSTVTKPGMLQLLLADGSVKRCLVLRKSELAPATNHASGDSSEYVENEVKTHRRPDMLAVEVMHSNENRNSFCVVVNKEDNKTQPIPDDTMVLNDGSVKDFDSAMLSGYGVSASPASAPELHWGDTILCPDGKAYSIQFSAYAHNKGWYNADTGSIVAVSENANQVAPITTSNKMVIPQGSRILAVPRKQSYDPADQTKNVHAVSFVQLGNMDAFLTAFANKNYKKVRLTSNGSEVTVSGEKSSDRPMSVKEASLHLVRDYGVETGVARSMIKEISCRAYPGNANSELFLIEKKAAMEDPDWQNAAIPKHDFTNRGEVKTMRTMPTVLEDPAQLQKAITTAAEDGIKEVFDVTALKLLIRQNQFAEEIHGDLPVFMKVLDSLCKKLFMLYWHTEEFKDQYGSVKLKSIEDSIKNTINSLSDLTIFFKVRSVDGDQGYGNDGGDLMEGHNL